MKKQKFGHLTYSQLFDKFSVVFKQEYEENSKTTPLYTILNNSLNRLLSDYYPIYILWVSLTVAGFIFLFITQYPLIGLAYFTIWFLMMYFIFAYLARIPLLKSINTLKSNIKHISFDLVDSDYSSDEVIQILANFKDKRKVDQKNQLQNYLMFIQNTDLLTEDLMTILIDNRKEELLENDILLEKYYELKSQTYSNNISLRDKDSSPAGRLLCFKLINDISKIPISDKETKLLVSLLFRIGGTNISSHITNLNKIDSLISIDNLESSTINDINDVKYFRNQVNTSIIILERSLNKARDIYSKLDKISPKK